MVRKVICPQCGSDWCFPTHFRSDACCVTCGETFDWNGENWWSRLMRRLFYR